MEGQEENEFSSPEEEAEARREIQEEIFGEGGEKPHKETESETPPEKPKGEEEDPYAGLSPALRTEFESLKEQAGQVTVLSERLKQSERRIGALTTDLKEAKDAAAKAAAKEVEEKEGDAPSQKEIDAAETDEEWEELKKDYPEWAEATEKREAKLRKKIEGLEGQLNEYADLKEKVGELLEKGNGSAEVEKTTREQAKVLVTLAYPKWLETVNTENFKQWIFSQGNDVKRKFQSWNALDAIDVLDKYTEHSTQKSAEQIREDRQKRLRRSVVPEGRAIQNPPKTEDEMTDEEYRKKVGAEIWTEN